MLNSTVYHRQCKLSCYIKRVKEFENKMKMLIPIDYKSKPNSFLIEKCNKLLSDKSFKFCRYNNIDNESFISAFNQMVEDYFNKNCRFLPDSNLTLYDVCLRNLGNRFKNVFNNCGTRNILLALYEYLDKVPHYITIKNKPLSDYPLSTDCYFRHYVNCFFCYDIVINLLENYKTLEEMDQLIFLETLIDDILYLNDFIL